MPKDYEKEIKKLRAKLDSVNMPPPPPRRRSSPKGKGRSGPSTSRIGKRKREDDKILSEKIMALRRRTDQLTGKDFINPDVSERAALVLKNRKIIEINRKRREKIISDLKKIDQEILDSRVKLVKIRNTVQFLSDNLKSISRYDPFSSAKIKLEIGKFHSEELIVDMDIQHNLQRRGNLERELSRI